jgi:methionyl aminopeptidase
MKPWQIVTETLKLLEKSAIPGVTTLELDKIAETEVIRLGGIPYNKGYHPKWAKDPYPNTICVNINDQIAHNIPSERVLKDGDVVSFDIGVTKDGLCGDAGFTMIVGDKSKAYGNAERLIRYAKRTLYVGIQQVKAGAVCGDISRAMEVYASQHGFLTSLRFSGHGIGEQMHMPPKIPCALILGYGDEILEEGQMICLEPFLTYKDRLGQQAPDGWGYSTSDGRNSAFFEHQLLVTKDGCEILTAHISKD